MNAMSLWNAIIQVLRRWIHSRHLRRCSHVGVVSTASVGIGQHPRELCEVGSRDQSVCSIGRRCFHRWSVISDAAHVDATCQCRRGTKLLLRYKYGSATSTSCQRPPALMCKGMFPKPSLEHSRPSLWAKIMRTMSLSQFM